MPSGSFTGINLLAGRGPGIKIRISSIGNVETDLRSEFTAQGINQTLHRIYLQVKCQVSILTPFEDITRDPRMKERKKYGLKKARKAPQFSKR